MQDSGVIGSYAIAGAVAALYYLEPTVTRDLDILLSFDETPTTIRSGLITLSPILSFLGKRGYRAFSSEGVEIGGWPVQFLPVASDLDGEALAEASPAELPRHDREGAIPTRVLRPEHIVATALRIGRPKDRVRIAQFLDEDAVDPARLKDVLLRHGLTIRWRAFCVEVGRPDPLQLGAEA